MKKLICGIVLLSGSLLGAQPDEAKVLDRVREAYWTAALVVRAEVKQEGGDTVLYPTENWRSAPGYEAGRQATRWHYTQDGKCSWADWAWLGREVVFVNGRVAEKVARVYYD